MNQARDHARAPLLWALGCLGFPVVLLWLFGLSGLASGFEEALTGIVTGLFGFFTPLSLACFAVAAWQFGHRGGGLASLGLGVLYMALLAWGLHSLVGWPLVFLGMALAVLLGVVGKVFAS